MMKLHTQNTVLIAALFLGCLLFLVMDVKALEEGGFLYVFGWAILIQFLCFKLLRCPYCGHYLHNKGFYYAPWIGNMCNSCKRPIH